MTIEINQPELEALISERIQRGQSVEEIMIEAFGLSAGRSAKHASSRSLRGFARGDGEKLTETLIKERASENAHDDAAF